MYYLEKSQDERNEVFAGPFALDFHQHVEAWTLRSLAGSLRINKGGGVDVCGGGGARSQWRREAANGGRDEIFRNVADPTKVLRWDGGELAAKTTLSESDPATWFRVSSAGARRITPPHSRSASWTEGLANLPSPARSRSLSGCDRSGSSLSASASEIWRDSGSSLGAASVEALWRDGVPELEARDLEAFARRGYLVVRRAVARDVARRARRAVNLELCAPGGGSGRPWGGGAPRVCPKAARDGAVVDALYSSDAWTLAGRLLGREHVCLKRAKCEIHVSAPSPDVDAALAAAEAANALGTTKHWRVDSDDATALKVYVALSDAGDEKVGSLVVYPGSHATLFAWERQAAGRRRAPRPRLVGGVELELGEGDVAFLHPKLATAWAVNASPDPAIAATFRLQVTHPDDDGGLLGAFAALRSAGGPIQDAFDELAEDLHDHTPIAVDDDDDRAPHHPFFVH